MEDIKKCISPIYWCTVHRIQYLQTLISNIYKRATELYNLNEDAFYNRNYSDEEAGEKLQKISKEIVELTDKLDIIMMEEDQLQKQLCN